MQNREKYSCIKYSHSKKLHRRLAQLVEQHSDKVQVTGSFPVLPTIKKLRGRKVEIHRVHIPTMRGFDSLSRSQLKE